MQNHYNLLAREEEREMLPLCADEGVGTIVWSPLARGRLARDNVATTNRSERDPLADMLYTEQASDAAIIKAVGRVADNRGVSRAQVALAWLRTNPVVVAPLIGATNQSHIDDAVASLQTTLTADEISALESPYTPRYDLQGISDDKELARISAMIGI
jgi:aryl-alcohol dehydrogenase-like predicted oxidoreductase